MLAQFSLDSGFPISNRPRVGLVPSERQYGDSVADDPFLGFALHAMFSSATLSLLFSLRFAT